MPIHDQSYRRYGGARAALGRGWLVIAREGIKGLIRKRVMMAILLAGWIQFVGRAIWMWLEWNVPQTAIFATTAQTFRDFLWWQGFVVFVVAIYVGAGLIANDKRANALQIYLSKPLLRSEYIAGKAAILFVFLALVTWAPAILLLFVQVLLSGSFTFLKANVFLFPAITVAALLESLLVTFMMLALSSLSKSSRYVAILYAGILFFSAAVYNVMAAITGSTTLAYLSLSANLTHVVDVIFRMPPRYDTPWPVSLTVIVGLVVLSISVLERRVRGVEVVT